MRVNHYQVLEEKALANFELLLNYLKIDFKLISPVEYDFLNPLRDDKNFGACRFNVEKGKGADFAGINFTAQDYQKFGPGFSKEDFVNNTKDNQSNWGFNVIGLWQRLQQKESYKAAAEHLDQTLKDLSKIKTLVGTDQASIDARIKKIQEANYTKLKMASKIWDYCGDYKDTLGEVYLNSRYIFLDAPEPNMRFHAKIKCQEAGKNLPALTFKVERVPNDGIVAIHRIYLGNDGSHKAKVSNPKMALGSIKGAGIWFGTPGPTLAIVEGVENALSIRTLGFGFVVCTINAVNFAGLVIPSYVQNIILLPDPDQAGLTAAQKAKLSYTAQGKRVTAKLPKQIPGIKKTDWNDLLKNAARQSSSVGSEG